MFRGGDTVGDKSISEVGFRYVYSLSIYTLCAPYTAKIHKRAENDTEMLRETWAAMRGDMREFKTVPSLAILNANPTTNDLLVGNIIDKILDCYLLVSKRREKDTATAKLSPPIPVNTLARIIPTFHLPTQHTANNIYPHVMIIVHTNKTHLAPTLST